MSRLHEALCDFIDAPTWNASQAVLEQHATLLLSEEVDPLFDNLRERAADDAERIQELDVYQKVLKACRKGGIEPVFARIVQPEALNELMTEIEVRRALAPPTVIPLCQSALALIERERDPELWAWIHDAWADGLVHIYGEARPEAIEEAIDHYQQTLAVFDPDTYPDDWGLTYNKLGNAYNERIHGERAANIEQALQHYRTALEVYTRTDHPGRWVMVHNNLAAAYLDRIVDDRGANVEQAIGHCQQALKAVTIDDDPEQWAMVHHTLGTAYLDRIEGGRRQNIETALHHLQQARQVYTRDDYPVEWAKTLYNLGVAYRERIEGDKGANIEQAIAYLKETRDIFTRERWAYKWAVLHNHLGAAYVDRVSGGRSDNIEQALSHFEQALEVLSTEEHPEAWAGVQNNLTIAYRNRIAGTYRENIETARRHALAALGVFTQDSYPFDWAMANNSLGNIYRRRIEGERADNIEQAIHHFRQALQVYTEANYPERWAMLQNNLGTVYMIRQKDHRIYNIEQAIIHYLRALEQRTRDELPLDWATTHSNLGNAYMERQDGDRAENLERALRHLDQAASALSPETVPEQWASMQVNKGLTYWERVAGDREANLDQAIHHLRQAGQIYRQDAYPYQWALVVYNLGNVFANRKQGGRDENIRQALAYYEQALSVYTLETHPFEHRLTQRRCGDAFFAQQHWSAALTAYQAASRASETLYTEAFSQTGRLAEAGQTAYLYNQMAYCLAQMEQYEQALVTTEQGKARLLHEVLTVSAIRQRRLPDEWIETYHTITALEADLRQMPEHSHQERDTAERLAQARRKWTGVVEQMAREYPDISSSMRSLADMTTVLPDKSTLIAPVVTEQGTVIFVVPNECQRITTEHILWLDNLTYSEVTTWLRGKAGWLNAYLAYRDDPPGQQPAFEDFLDEITQRLWDRLIGPIHRLVDPTTQQLVIMPSGRMQMLPLHAAWREEHGDRQYLLDDYLVSYTLSLYALKAARARAEGAFDRSVVAGGVNDYQDMLPLRHAVEEAQIVGGLFEESRILHNDEVTVAALKQTIPQRSYLHLACHGTFAWGDDVQRAGLALGQGQTLSLADILSGVIGFEQTRLVVLSACETAITDIWKTPDEFLGLPTAFIRAGVPAVVSSQWAVNDRSTALLMERFYHNYLAEGLSLPHALRDAQQWLRDLSEAEVSAYHQQMDTRFGKSSVSPNTQAGYSNPFHWAAFTITGA